MKRNIFGRSVYVLLALCISVLLVSCPDTNTLKPEETVLVSIAVTVPPSKSIYSQGDTLDTGGLVITAAYSDNTTKAVTENCTFSDLDSSTVGSQTITVSYTEGGVTKTTTFDVMAGVTLLRIELTSPPAKTEYANSEKLDLTGMVITAFYDENIEQVVTHMSQATGFLSGKAGEQTVTVSYNGKEVTFTVTVAEAPRGNTYKENPKGQRVIHTMWGEPEEDPRQVIGYRLERTDTLYFDHYVLLYGIRLRDADCANDNTRVCNRTGLHLCIENKIQQYYIDNYDTYIKPVRDAGIKFILSIVPKNTGVSVGTLYRWPMEQWFPWKDWYGEEYPYDEKAVQVLLEQLKELYRVCPFDGIGYDEEYGSIEGTPKVGRNEVYPNTASYPGIHMNTAWRIGGENILRFMNDINQALGIDLIHESYEYRYSGTIPAEYTLPGGNVLKRDELLDYCYHFSYGGFAENSGNTGIPNSKYGPMPIAICDTNEYGGPRPLAGTLEGHLEDHLKGNYGVMMYYCLRSRDEITAKFPNFFGSGSPDPEVYFSIISSALHGKNTEYVGPDYARLWEGGNLD